MKSLYTQPTSNTHNERYYIVYIYYMHSLSLSFKGIGYRGRALQLHTFCASASGEYR